MMQRFVVLLLVSMTLTGTQSALAAEWDGVTVMAWNIYRASAREHNHRKPEQWNTLHEATRSLAREVDVLLLQEIDTAETASALFGPDYQYYVSRRASGSSATRDLQRTVTAVHKSLRVIDAWEYTKLDISGDPYGVDVLLESPQSGRRFRVLNVHLKERCDVVSAALRGIQESSVCKTLRSQYVELAAWVRLRRQEDVPFLVGGSIRRDLLADPDELLLLSGAENDADALVPANVSDPECWNGRFDAWSDYLLLDTRMRGYFLAGSFREGLYRGHVFDDAATGLSDHCPVKSSFDF